MGTDQNTPRLLATGSPAEHRQLPLRSPFPVPRSPGPIENTPGTKRCPGLQEPSRGPSEVPRLERGHTTLSPSTGKASPWPCPCSACSPCVRDSLAQHCPRPQDVLHLHGDPRQGKPTSSGTKPASREMPSAQRRGLKPWMGEPTPKWLSRASTALQQEHRTPFIQ